MTLTLDPVGSATSPVTAPTYVAPTAPAAGSSRNSEVNAWVQRMAELTGAADVHWCTGDSAEWTRLTAQLVESGSLVRLDPEWRPNSFLARSDPRDVARVEERTFICSEREEDAGPTNNWRAPAEMRIQLDTLFRGSMRGRTMFVVPFSMGPIGSPLAKLGVQVTDSPYAVLSMGIMTRMGTQALDQIGPDTEWVPAVHSVGYPLIDDAGVVRDDVRWPCNDTKYITHFPETREIWSFGSGYGGNSLLGKKCMALRIASVLARDEGWLAEHMLLVKVTSPAGRSRVLAAAFPSACGKTNFAMMQPSLPGWKVETIGDDIAWMRPDAQGRLRAINPERGFFGVAPGTGETTNPTAIDTIWGNTIFTNVALRDDDDVWWEGMTDVAPRHLRDWKGDDWHRGDSSHAAHPNGRFTVPAEQCPSMAPEWDDPEGVVVDAILFGGRRATNIPLVAEATDWAHGVFMGATISSERTAAAEGTLGELRHDPFAMLPFCGYNMADYWAHWLRVGRSLAHPPKIFQVNWFRRGADGSFLWPGFGENSRVVDWIVRRLDGRALATWTPAGHIPWREDFALEGTGVDEDIWEELTAIDTASWLAECDLTEQLFDRFGRRVPHELRAQLASLRWKLERSAETTTADSAAA